MKKFFTTLLLIALLILITGCTKIQDDDIYIVFTNDVHCAVDDNLGYASVGAYKKELEKEHKYVTLVDNGDFSAGRIIGSLTIGHSPTSIMNSTGYEIATLGNHEFDFGVNNLNEYVLGYANFDIVSCNITYTGKKDNVLKNIKPYVIKEYGNTKVAYIGVTTPSAIVESTPSSFMEDGEYVYNLMFGENEDSFYDNIQKVVNKVRNKVDYVVLLAHCGVSEANKPYRSIDIVQNTYGIDVVIDGHSHNVMLGETYQNNKGEDIQIWQTGTELTNIGQIILTKNHTIEGMLISEYDKKDKDIQNAINAINEELDVGLNQVAGYTPFNLLINESIADDSFRQIRNRETNLGDLCSDALRYIYSSDIAIRNGGGIRTNIKAGEITLRDIVDANPFQNVTAMIKVSGQTILDMLEYSVYNTLPYTDDGDKSVGEFGGFLQVSGIKFTVDTSIETPVIIENEMFKEIKGNRRVSDVYVEKDGKWEPLNINETYTIAGTQYILMELGNGYTMFNDCEIISKEGVVDSNCVIDYINYGLNGVIPDIYKETQERIIIK